jgi:hypothetical protein
MTRSVRERRAAVIGIRVMTLVSVADFYASCDVMRMPQHRGAAAPRPRESEWRKIKNKNTLGQGLGTSSCTLQFQVFTCVAPLNILHARQ